MSTSTRNSSDRSRLLKLLIPFLLATVAFLVYLPSLKSDFVYDARIEILEEGFIPNLSNLPEVLTLKVLGMNLMLADRPGQLLYMMVIAAFAGKNPFLYHLCSNLIHAANVALLYLLLLRIIASENRSITKTGVYLAEATAAASALIFAVHPIATESVANISYSSDLLVAFFAFSALIAATYFNSEKRQVAITTGALGVIGSFCAVTCKESGAVVPLLLLIYWALFQRDQPWRPWFLFLGSAAAGTVAFLTARFILAHATPLHPTFLGGSFSSFLIIQPRLWIYMMGKILFPVHLSADYTSANVAKVSTMEALVSLALIIFCQFCLGMKSRIGALGVAIYWGGLAAVSNFIPLFIFVADRYYYLPLAGAVMQLCALALLSLRGWWVLWISGGVLVVALSILTDLTVLREGVFASEISLWSATLSVSPESSIARSSLGDLFLKRGMLDQAIYLYATALKINPSNPIARTNLGNAFIKKGKVDQAIEQYRYALSLRPDVVANYLNLGNALKQSGHLREAMAQFQEALKIDPANSHADADLKELVLEQSGRSSQ